MNNINEALNYIYSFMCKKNLHKNSFNHINNVKEILNILYDKDIVPKSDFYDSDIKLTDYLEGYRSLDFDDLKNYETIFY